VAVNPLKSFLDVRRREVPFVVLMFLYFFLVITVFWILKPIKKDIFVDGFYGDVRTFDLLGMSLGGSEAEQIAKVANMLVALVATIVFTLLSRTLHRHRLTLAFAGFSIVSLLSFTAVLNDPGEVTVWLFYLFGDLFNTLMVATFFAFLNDSVAPNDAKRIYGPIVLGGVAGGAFGSLWVRAQIDTFSPIQWLLICAGVTAVIAAIATTAGRLVEKNPPVVIKASAPEPKSTGNAALEGARLVFRSRYLLAIVTIVALYEIISTILDYQFTKTVAERAGDFGEHVATVYAITNTFALAVQLFLTSFVMTRFGVRVALLIMPIAILGNSAAFVALPILWVGSALNTTDNGLNYSINQSARESLYTPTSRDEKYKAKAFIDMFVQRFAKAIAVGINLILAAAIGGLEGARWLSIIVIALVAVWMVAASYAGRRFQEISGAKEAQAAE
jgi:AAA family ATP:ADP antiporter